MRGCARDLENLIICAGRLVLDNNPFANGQERKENINVDAVIRQVADVNLSCGYLRAGVPQNVPIFGIPTEV
jgi:hypothetical protein